MKKSFKILLSLILIMSFLIVGIPGEEKARAAGDDLKLVFLYSGLAPDSYAYGERRNGENYFRPYSVSNIDSLSNANGFVILPHQSKELCSYDWNSTKGYYNYLTFIAEAKKTINTVLRSNPNAKIWIATPPTIGDGKHIPPTERLYKAYFADLKANIAKDIWNNNIEGIYLHDEDYYGYDKLNYMKGLSSYISKDLGKKFLWSPYYSMEVNHKKISKALEQNIFDYIVVQPNYYFNKGQTTDNTGIIANWVKNQSINGKRSSRTRIGVQMEINNGYRDNLDNGGYRKRYQAYVNTFKPLVGKYPFSFYCGDVTNLGSSKLVDPKYLVETKIQEFYSK